MPKFSKNEERVAWTAFITGEKPAKPSKYLNQRVGRYDSKKEAEVATKLAALERAGKITNLEHHVPIVLVPGRDGIKGVILEADFVYLENGERHILDVKGGQKGGTRTQVYRLKKRLALLLLGLEIEEV